MIVSGLTYRSLVRNNAFTSYFDLSFSNVTGSARIGFSGNNKTYQFNFISGKILDNQNRYFSSYTPDSQVLLSTNFSGSAYDYFIDNQAVTYSGSKDNFYVENFFIDPSGVIVDASVIINSVKPSLVFNYPDSFITGQYITGHLTTNSISGFKIFTGSFESSSSFEFISLPSSYITSASSGQVLINQKENSVGRYASSFQLETSAGDYSFDLYVTGVESPYLDYVFNLNQESLNEDAVNDWKLGITTPTDQTGVTKVADAQFIYSYFTNYDSLEPASLPISISLSYVSGITGYYGLVTDVTVTSGGNGYLSPPIITFSGGGFSSAASGQAFLGLTNSDFDNVTQISLTSNGAGYTSVPTIVFSGGTGIINNENPTTASGQASIVSYTKSFTGCFNLLTGINGNYSNYRTLNYTSSSGYTKTVSFSDFNTPIDIRLEYLNTFDTNPLVAKLSISGINNNLIETYITGVR